MLKKPDDDPKTERSTGAPTGKNGVLRQALGAPVILRRRIKDGNNKS
jgi:hypothetical protein